MSVTDQEILDSLRTAMLNLALSGSQSYTILGRTFTRLNIGDLQKAIDIYEERVDAANQPGIAGGTILVGLGQLGGF